MLLLKDIHDPLLVSNRLYKISAGFVPEQYFVQMV